MIFVRLFFLSIFLYYTEARSFYDDYVKPDESNYSLTSGNWKEVPIPAPLERQPETDNLTATDYSNQTKVPEDSKETLKKEEITTTETYETTTTRRPYHSYWGYGFENTNGTSATYVSSGTIDDIKPYDWDNKRESKVNTTTRKPHSDWDNELENKTTTINDNRYNRTTDGNEPPATEDDDVGYGYLTIENGYLTAHFPKTDSNAVEKTTTTERPYVPDWNHWGRTSRAYYTTSSTEDSDTTTTQRPYVTDWNDWERKYWPYYTSSTTEDSVTTTSTTEIPYITDWNQWGRTDWPYYTTSTTEDSVTTTTTTETTTSTTEEPATTTTTRYVICPRLFTTTAEPRRPTSTDAPVTVSINSSVNTNEAGNYVAIADFLKKLTGTIYTLPSASNIAPNANVTNLAVANGNGNLFFYVSN